MTIENIFDLDGNPTSTHLQRYESYASAWSDLTDKTKTEVKAQSGSINYWMTEAVATARNMFHFTALSDGNVAATVNYYLFQDLNKDNIGDISYAESSASLSLLNNSTINQVDSRVHDSREIINDLRQPGSLSEEAGGIFYVEKWFNEGAAGHFDGRARSKALALTISKIPDDTQPVIPEPSTMLLFSAGLLGAFVRRRRRS